MSCHTDSIQITDLGAEVFRCRPQPIMRWVGTQGGLGLFGAYFLYPVVLLPFLALLPTGLVVNLLDAVPPWFSQSLLWLTFISAYCILFWLMYGHPRGDHLVLYEHGFRIRTTFKQRRFFFPDVEYFSFGLRYQIFHRYSGVLKVLQPGQASGVLEFAKSAFNVHLKSGRVATFKAFLYRFEPSDVEQFFHRVLAHHPHLAIRDEV